VRLLLVIGLLVLALYSGCLEDVLRLAGSPGCWPARSPCAGGPCRWPRRTRRRGCWWLLLAASALGPVVALLSPYANGPLAWFADVLAVPQPDADTVAAYCAEPDLVELCRGATVQASYGRFPSMVMSALPALVLPALAEGLHRGRRFAWWGALVGNLAMAGLLGWYAGCWG
jgi:phosphatidylglycerol lysyltransferase